MIRRIRSLWADRGGVAAIEFVLVAPFLVTLWLGMTEYANAHLVARKANIAAQSVADLVAQERTASTAELDDFLEAGRQIMTPYPAAGLAITVMSVIADPDDGTVSTAWQYPDGAPATVPPEAAALLDPGESLIVVRLTYSYQPILGNVIDTMTIDEQAVARPRLLDAIERAP